MADTVCFIMVNASSLRLFRAAATLYEDISTGSSRVDAFSTGQSAQGEQRTRSNSVVCEPALNCISGRIGLMMVFPEGFGRRNIEGRSSKWSLREFNCWKTSVTLVAEWAFFANSWEGERRPAGLMTYLSRPHEDFLMGWPLLEFRRRTSPLQATTKPLPMHSLASVQRLE